MGQQALTGLAGATPAANERASAPASAPDSATDSTLASERASRQAGETARRPVGRQAAERGRAILSVVLIAVAPQGRIAAEGFDSVTALCHGSGALPGLPRDAVDDIARMALRSLMARGAGHVMADVQGLFGPHATRAALCLAVRAAMVAGGIDRARMDRLGALAARLGVAPADLAAILDVMAMLDPPAAPAHG